MSLRFFVLTGRVALVAGGSKELGMAMAHIVADMTRRDDVRRLARVHPAAWDPARAAA